MTKLSGWTYLIVGIFVSAASYRINYEKFQFFFYSGIIFASFGVVRIIFDLIKKQKESSLLDGKSKVYEKEHNQSKRTYTSANSLPRINHPSHAARHAQGQTQRLKYCPNCANPARLHDNFCSRCGVRV